MSNISTIHLSTTNVESYSFFPYGKKNPFVKLKRCMFPSSFVFHELEYEPEVFYLIQKNLVTKLFSYFSLYLQICIKIMANS